MSVRTIMFTAILAVLTFNSGWLFAQDADKSYYLKGDTLVVTRVKGTNQFHAYSKTVGKWNTFTFPEGVKAVPIISNGTCAFDLEGKAITELVAVDNKGNWCNLKLPAATQKCTPVLADKVAACVVDGRAYAFSSVLGKWDSVAATGAPRVSNDTAMIVSPDSIAVFSATTGKWAVAKTTK